MEYLGIMKIEEVDSAVVYRVSALNRGRDISQTKEVYADEYNVDVSELHAKRVGLSLIAVYPKHER